MIDPSLTEVWHRRVAAALVDLGATVGAFVALTLLQVERFSPDDGGLFAPADFDRMAALSQTVNRYVEVGGTRYVLAGAELVMTLVVTALVALAIHVALPGVTGTSPGKKLFGLRVVTTRGDVIDVTQAAVRTAVGVVDLLPLVAPWAVGAVVARRSPLHQRLGDRAAGTAVVDARRPLLVAGEAGEAAAVAASPHGRAATGAELAVPPAAVAAAPAPVPVEPHAAEPHAEPRHVAPVGEPAPAATPSAVDEPPAVATPGATPARPVRDLHRGAPPTELFVERRGTRAGGQGRAAPPPQHRGAKPTTDQHRTARAAGDVAPAPGGPPDVDWPRPRAEPAPVWDPATLSEWLGPVAVPADERPERPEPAADHPRRRADDPSGAAPATGGPGEEPVWDEQWQAWLCFDRATGRWLRHDEAAGAWEPIS